MDEISILGDTAIAELNDCGEIGTYVVKPEDFGIKLPSEETLRPSSDRKEEALSFLRILASSDCGPRYEIVCLNAAPIFYLMGYARNLPEGFEQAGEVIKSGRAIAKLMEWVTAQNSDPIKGRRTLERLLGELDAKVKPA